MCTTHTALMRCALSSASAAPIAATSAPRRQSVSMNIGLQLQALRHLLPQRGEPAGAAHQHRVARRQRVGQRGFPGAGAGGGVDDHRPAGPEDRLEVRQQLPARCCRIPGRDGRWWDCRSRAARGPARWSGRGSAGNAGRHDGTGSSTRAPLGCRGGDCRCWAGLQTRGCHYGMCGRAARSGETPALVAEAGLPGPPGFLIRVWRRRTGAAGGRRF